MTNISTFAKGPFPPEDEAEAHHLWAHYEGWIAGMALAVNQAAFTGSDLFGPSGAGEQDWFEYVETEVFQSLPAELQDFLSNTSILNELEPGVDRDIHVRVPIARRSRFWWYAVSISPLRLESLKAVHQ